MASNLEAQRTQLGMINKKLESDLFMLMNSCNIRHNNKDESSGKYRRFIAEMSNEDLEKIYDETYQMCLLAFMLLEHADRKNWLEETKSNLVN